MVVDEVTRIGPFAEELAALAERVRASVVLVHGHRTGMGSGVLWNDDGVVITNHHVTPGEKATIDFGRHGQVDAHVVARSERHDLAVLQADGRFPDPGMHAAQHGDPASLRVGDLVVAVGNPHGERNVVTLGMVSGQPGKQRRGSESIPLAITLRPGNSGGALANVQGQVVGIPNMVTGPGQARAVPTSLVETLLAKAGGEHAHLGVTGVWVSLPPRQVQMYELLEREALLIQEVEPESAAESGGLMAGDVIVSAQQHVGERSADRRLVTQLQLARPGQAMRLTLMRGGHLRWNDVVPRSH